MRLGIINACLAAKRIAVLHDTIHDHSLDALVITETWIKDTTPDVIQHDLALKGFSVMHVHHGRGCGFGKVLVVDQKGGGLALV